MILTDNVYGSLALPPPLLSLLIPVFLLPLMLLVCPDGFNMAAVGGESDDDDDDDDDDGDIVELAPVPLWSLLLLLGSLIRVTRSRPLINSRSSLLSPFSSCSCGCGCGCDCDCGGRGFITSFSVPRSSNDGGSDDVMVDDDDVVVVVAAAASEVVVVDNGAVNDGIVVDDDVTVLLSSILFLCPPVPLLSLDTLA